MNAASQRLADRLDEVDRKVMKHGLHHDPRTRAHRSLVRQRDILWANLTDRQLLQYAVAIMNGYSFRSLLGETVLDYLEARECIRSLRARRQRSRRALGLVT